MDAPSLMGILTAISIAVSLAIWIPIALKVRVRRTEVYLSGEPQAGYRLGITEVSWSVRRVFEKLYAAILNYVQTGVFNDWFAISLPYLILLLTLLTVVTLVGGGG
ncbi:MAG: hypothetical protein RMH84_02105 [Sulfolobales archaeon]|nr:hypothetical protein [Sulfolobales archaeon]MCX8208055.1 hypothetical protein [Sulfolobales archaeon]MDW8010371.1 hypothetical protein [Sulfolobales archaeon]